MCCPAYLFSLPQQRKERNAHVKQKQQQHGNELSKKSSSRPPALATVSASSPSRAALSKTIPSSPASSTETSTSPKIRKTLSTGGEEPEEGTRATQKKKIKTSSGSAPQQLKGPKVQVTENDDVLVDGTTLVPGTAVSKCVVGLRPNRTYLVD